MIYWVAKFFAGAAGYDPVVAWLSSNGFHSSAWEIASTKQDRALISDPTWTYTINFAEAEVEISRLAFDAQAYEWAWINASSALAIFEWKGQLEGDFALAAKRLKQDAEEHIDELRIEDLHKRFEESKKEHNSTKELSFKKRIASTKLELWRKQKLPRPRISNRPF